MGLVYVRRREKRDRKIVEVSKGLFVSDDRIQKSFGLNEIKKMSVSVQRSFAESFSFNGKHVRSVYLKDAGQCLISKDVY